MNAHQGELPATKADVEGVAAGLHTEFVRLENKFDALENKVDGLEQKVKGGFEVVLEELQGMREEMRIGRQAGRIESVELSQRMDMLEQEVKKVKERVGII